MDRMKRDAAAMEKIVDDMKMRRSKNGKVEELSGVEQRYYRSMGEHLDADGEWYHDPDSECDPPHSEEVRREKLDWLLIGLLVGAGIFFFLYALISLLMAYYLG